MVYQSWRLLSALEELFALLPPCPHQPHVSPCPFHAIVLLSLGSPYLGTAHRHVQTTPPRAPRLDRNTSRSHHHCPLRPFSQRRRHHRQRNARAYRRQGRPCHTLPQPPVRSGTLRHRTSTLVSHRSGDLHCSCPLRVHASAPRGPVASGMCQQGRRPSGARRHDASAPPLIPRNCCCVARGPWDSHSRRGAA